MELDSEFRQRFYALRITRKPASSSSDSMSNLEHVHGSTAKNFLVILKTGLTDVPEFSD
jgi:hypothetical protein